jgi:hypothetical protein
LGGLSSRAPFLNRPVLTWKAELCFHDEPSVNLLLFGGSPTSRQIADSWDGNCSLLLANKSFLLRQEIPAFGDDLLRVGVTILGRKKNESCEEWVRYASIRKGEHR